MDEQWYFIKPVQEYRLNPLIHTSLGFTLAQHTESCQGETREWKAPKTIWLAAVWGLNIPPLMYRTRPQWGQSQRHLWGDNKLSNQLDENLQLLNKLFW